MSSQDDWLQAREDYANRLPDPTKPKLPQSGVWLDRELAFFLNEDVDTFRKKLKKAQVPHAKWGNCIAVRIDEFARGKLYAEEASEEDDPEDGERGRLDMAAPERPVRGRGKRAGKPGEEAAEGHGRNLRPRKGRKG